MNHLDTLKEIESAGFEPAMLIERFRQELRILSDAYTEQLLRFGRELSESEGVMYSIMVAQAYCVKRLLELNGKLSLEQALERYAEIELENYATADTLATDLDYYRLHTLRCVAQEIKIGEMTYYKLYSPIDQRTRDYKALPSGAWLYSARRSLPRVVDFVSHSTKIDNDAP